VLRVDPGRVAPSVPLQQLGLDSLMTIELRHRLEDDLGVRLSATVVWRHPTTAALAAHLLLVLGLDAGAEAPEGNDASTITEEDGTAMLAVLEAFDS
jgi:acyl carrier protein